MCIRLDPQRSGLSGLNRLQRGLGLGRAGRGVTLIELVVAMTLASVVMTGVWSAWTLLLRRSVDPLVARQALAVAQSLLREIELQPLPGTAVAGSTPGRTGYASINDYNGLVMNGIRDAEGNVVPGLEGYDASVSVANLALSSVPAGSGWWVTVTVTGPGGEPLQLAQWRSAR